MFTRSLLRPVQAASKTCFRTYATKPTSQSARNLPLGYGLAASAAALTGYTLLTGVAADGARNPGRPGAPPSSGEERNIPNKAGDGAVKCFTGGDQGWVSLKLESSEVINENTKRLRFHLPEEDSVSGLNVASALLTKYQGPHDAKPVIRPYTPVSDEDTAGYLDFIVKKYPDGPMSTHLHEMQPNQRIDMKGPIPKYSWEANKHDHIALIAGGTGITPMYQLCRAIFKNPSDKTKVTLVFGNIAEQDILLKHEFEDLEQQFPNRFRAFYTLDQPPASWTAGVSGRISKDLLKTVLPDSKAENVKIFVCGPPGLYQAISGAKKSPKDQGELTGMLAELGYSKDQVYKF